MLTNHEKQTDKVDSTSQAIAHQLDLFYKCMKQQ